MTPPAQPSHDSIDAVSLFCLNVLMALAIAVSYYGIQALIVFGVFGASACLCGLVLMLYELAHGDRFSLVDFAAQKLTRTTQ